MFLDSKGDVKVGDFGLAVERPETTPSPSSLSGAVTSSLIKRSSGQEVDDMSSASSSEAVVVSKGGGPCESDDLTGGVGTTLYRAPEQDALRYSKKVDIWALGIVFFEVFCAMFLF